jgi:hypothetical protein
MILKPIGFKLLFNAQTPKTELTSYFQTFSHLISVVASVTAKPIGESTPHIARNTVHSMAKGGMQVEPKPVY